MTPAEIDELIRRVEAGEEVRLIMPYGWVRTLGTHDLDDLYLARNFSALLEEAGRQMDAFVDSEVANLAHDAPRTHPDET